MDGLEVKKTSPVYLQLQKNSSFLQKTKKASNKCLFRLGLLN